MTAQQPISWKPTAASVEPTSAAKPAPESSAVEGAAFRELLERLESSARELSRRSESLEDTKDLSGAVQDAASSLSDALALRDSVLDAYRSAQQATKAQAEDVA
jgi:flagellar hook-basal body complex protein FliE